VFHFSKLSICEWCRRLVSRPTALNIKRHSKPTFIGYFYFVNVVGDSSASKPPAQTPTTAE